MGFQAGAQSAAPLGLSGAGTCGWGLRLQLSAGPLSSRCLHVSVLGLAISAAPSDVVGAVECSLGAGFGWTMSDAAPDRPSMARLCSSARSKIKQARAGLEAASPGGEIARTQSDPGSTGVRSIYSKPGSNSARQTARPLDAVRPSAGPPELPLRLAPPDVVGSCGEWRSPECWSTRGSSADGRSVEVAPEAHSI